MAAKTFLNDPKHGKTPNKMYAIGWESTVSILFVFHWDGTFFTQGDYGKKSSLQVFSLLCSEGQNFDYSQVGFPSQKSLVDCWMLEPDQVDTREPFQLRGTRSRDADFNGWTELPGWDEPTRSSAERCR